MSNINKKSSAKTILAETLKKLLYQKPFQKISVNELCETACVSRSAFYANFDDKYQLFSYCINEQRHILNSLMESHPPKEFLTVMLDYIQSNSKFFYHAFGSSYDEELSEIFYQFFNKQFTAILHEKMQHGMKLSGPVEYVSAFYLGGLNNMILRWIKSNYKISKEELAACQYHLLGDFVE